MNGKELSRQAWDGQNGLWHMQHSYLLSMISWLGTSTSCTHWPLMNHWFRYFSAECSTTNSWSTLKARVWRPWVGCVCESGRPHSSGSGECVLLPSIHWLFSDNHTPISLWGTTPIHFHSIYFRWFWLLQNAEHMTQIWPIRVSQFLGQRPNMTQSKRIKWNPIQLQAWKIYNLDIL